MFADSRNPYHPATAAPGSPGTGILPVRPAVPRRRTHKGPPMLTSLLRPALVLCTLFSLLAPARAARAQNITYEKYTLDNGMVVILHEDHALPVVAINLWYYVGAKDEPPRRSGFAHLFEHLMFMGTERVPGNDFDVIMETGGGSNNASTSLDRTNYFSSGPSELLPTLLWLDADRLEDLGRTMTKEKLDLQRDVVRNEIRQNVENTPYGRAEEIVYSLMYPPGHPYANAVYGTHEDLEAATVGNVKDFFANFYVPNNCSLVVSGDFDSAAVKPLIDRLFGSLPRSQPPGRKPEIKYPEPRLDRVVRVTMLDKVELPRVTFVFHAPPSFAEGDAEMDLLAAILGDGQSSRLYQRLVLTDKTAVDVTAYQDSALLGSLFHVEVSARPDADLNAIEAAMDDELARIARDGVQPAELEQRKATTELAHLSRLQSNLAVADQLNAYQFHFGEPNSFKRDLDRYRNATPATVQAWAKRVLTLNARAIVRVIPEEPDREESPRDTRPDSAAAPGFTPPTPVEFTVGDNIRALLWRKADLPLVAMQLQFQPAGPLSDNRQAGLAALTARMLEEGTGDLDGVAFARAMESLGAGFGASAGTETASAGITVLKRNFAPAATLMARAVSAPRLDTADWERVQKLHIDALRQEQEEPAAVAAKAASRVLFGADHPYGVPPGGLIETVQRLTLSDVREAHARIFDPANMRVLIAGDITPEEARSALQQAFAGWKPAAAPQPRQTLSRPMPASGDKLRLFIIDRPGAVQTVIRFAMPGPTLASDDRAKLRVLNTLFGGSFTSRLNQNLREAHGYTYGARSTYSMQPSAGSFTAGAAVRADVTGASLVEFFKEFERIRAGDISPEEAGKARKTFRTDLIQDFEGLGGTLTQAAALLAAGLPLESIPADLAAAAKLTAADLNALVKPARDAMPLGRGVLVLVGDKKTILEQIGQAGLSEPVELDADGKPLK